MDYIECLHVYNKTMMKRVPKKKNMSLTFFSFIYLFLEKTNWREMRLYIMFSWGNTDLM